MSSGEDQLTEAGRNILDKLLAQCTAEQVNMFNRMYKSVDEIELEKMPRAIEQCERTVQKNMESNSV